MSDHKHTPGPWAICNMVHGERGGPMTPSEIGEYVANSVRKTHGESGLARFLFIDGGDKDVCLIGNGSQGLANAELIVRAWQIPNLEGQIATLTAENERLRGALQTADETLIEVNLSNYGMDDVDQLNNSSIEASQIIRAALQPKEE